MEKATVAYGGSLTLMEACPSLISPIFYIHFFTVFIGVRQNESLEGNVNLLCCLAGSLYSILRLYWIEYKVVH